MASNPNRKFQGKPDTTPFFDGVAVTPSDTVLLDDPARALFIGTGGNVTLITGLGNAVLFKNLASGTILPGVVQRVNATATTATDIVALY